MNNLKRKWASIVVMLLVCMLVVSVSVLTNLSTAQTSFELTFQTAGPVGSGTTSPSGVVLSSDPIQIAANPTPGYSFVSWTADPPSAVTFANPSASSTTLTPSGDATITATFTQVQTSFELTFQTAGPVGSGTTESFGGCSFLLRLFKSLRIRLLDIVLYLGQLIHRRLLLLLILVLPQQL